MTSRAAGAGTAFSRALDALQLTVNGAVAAAVVVVGWGVARVVGARSGYLMVYGTLLALVMSWVVSRRRLQLEVTRAALPARVRCGQIVPVALRMTTRRRVSTFLLTDEIAAGLGSSARLPVGAVHPGAVVEHQYSIVPRRRGVYAVGPLVAEWSDPFGFTRHRQVLLEAQELIVHPPVEVVHDRVLTRMWEDPPIRPPVSKPWPVGFEFYGMRDYVPGDDLRRVVWAVLARTGRMMVREAEQGITDRVVIYLDTNADTHSPGDPSETFETAIRTAAAIGCRHLADGFAVTLVTNQGRVLPGLRGSQAHLTLLDALARLERDRHTMSDISHVLLEEAKGRPHLLVVTPRLDRGEAQRLRLIVQRGVGVVVAQMLWAESDLLSLTHAASLGCQVVQVPPDVSLEAVFARQVRAGVPG
jgi:uncharacterized protein (DUF58 family)